MFYDGSSNTSFYQVLAMLEQAGLKYLICNTHGLDQNAKEDKISKSS
jgi:hypothetical protein